MLFQFKTLKIVEPVWLWYSDRFLSWCPGGHESSDHREVLKALSAVGDRTDWAPGSCPAQSSDSMSRFNRIHTLHGLWQSVTKKPPWEVAPDCLAAWGGLSLTRISHDNLLGTSGTVRVHRKLPDCTETGSLSLVVTGSNLDWGPGKALLSNSKQIFMEAMVAIWWTIKQPREWCLH